MSISLDDAGWRPAPARHIPTLGIMKDELEPPRLQLTRICRAIRETAELRQEDIAALVGVTKGQISYLESGKSWPREANPFLDAYAKLDGTTISELWIRAIEAWRSSQP